MWGQTLAKLDQDREEKKRKQAPQHAPMKQEETEEGSLSQRVANLEMEQHMVSKQMASLMAWSCGSWKIKVEEDVAKEVMQFLEQYQSAVVKGQPHMWGPPRTAVCMGIVSHAEKKVKEAQSTANKAVENLLKHYVEEHAQYVQNPKEMSDVSLQFGMAKKIKANTHIIIKLRPTMQSMQTWTPLFGYLNQVGERLWAEQPPMTSQRAIEKQAKKHLSKKDKR
eukprot:gnl/MRDRNA2_/MRDRNA2_160587_c0_seq1.p2 gnl/MRDRNA2_/MRDRNA2_160587_c0~~gnl/MRDRNA2_/MRDRNA2_160587_c0_seq1.p2  ORF type:complete len:252 (+),score=69.31 gnl/MRDRNA2_/MRDRNA2_160587_c0_seq1:88-756(+)